MRANQNINTVDRIATKKHHTLLLKPRTYPLNMVLKKCSSTLNAKIWSRNRYEKIKFNKINKQSRERLTLEWYLAHQNIPNIIVFLIFYQCTRLLPLVVTSGTESRGAAKILGSGTQRKYDLISLFHLLNYNEWIQSYSNSFRHTPEFLHRPPRNSCSYNITIASQWNTLCNATRMTHITIN